MKRQIGILLSAVSLAVSLTASAAAANYSDEIQPYTDDTDGISYDTAVQ